MSTVSLVNARDRENRWSRILHMQQQLTGAPVALSDEVNQSEQTTNFHNRAIAWLQHTLLRSHGSLRRLHPPVFNAY